MSGDRRAAPPKRLRSILSVAIGFAPYMKGKRGRLALAIGAAVAVMLMKLLEPWPLKIIIDVYFFGLAPPAPIAALVPDAPTESTGFFVSLIAAIAVIAALGGVFYYVQRVTASTTALEATSALRVDIYAALLRLPISYHDNRRIGETLSRLTGDVRTLRDTFVSLPVRLSESVLMMGGVLAVMLWMDWRLTLVAVAFPLGLLWSTRRFGRRIRRALATQRLREGAVASGAAQAFGAIRLIQALGAEDREAARLDGVDRRGVDAAVAAARHGAALQTASAVLLGLAVAAVVGVAAWRVTAGRLTPGDLVVFVVYLRTLYGPIRSVASLVSRTARAIVAGERVLATLRTPPDIADRPDARRAKDFTGEIVFDDVSFAHSGGGPVLKNIDLRIAAGQRVALVGPSGAGKTTLASLPPRFLDPTTGAVRIDGEDIRDLRLATLRAQIAIVFQEPALFSLTIAENIAYGNPDATPDDVAEAVSGAGVAEVIASLPDGLETRIGERGARLSGGQRQCVAIARAMIRKAPIVILDEPTTGLDPELAETVLDALARLTAGRTVLMITHDPRVLRPGDRLVRLAGGGVVEDRPYRPDDTLSFD